MKEEQKYFTEVSLLQATKGVMLIKPAEFEKMAKMPAETVATLNEAHIYFVCQRPRVRITKANQRDAEGIRLTVEIGEKAGHTTREVTIPGKWLPPDATGAKTYENGAYFTLTKGTDDMTGFMPPEQLLSVSRSLPELGQLEVVYIGQAYGDSGERSAIDRLKAHSTLQRVLAELAHTSWWMEPVILLFIYDSPQLISKMDGRGSPEIAGDEDRSHFHSVLDAPLSDAQLVTVAEASLIRYFRPRYNIHFKDNYPTTQMTHLRDAYRLDYNAIITEIDTEDIFMTTHSEEQKPNWHHIAQFDLHDTAERMSFFELSATFRKQAEQSPPPYPSPAAGSESGEA